MPGGQAELSQAPVDAVKDHCLTLPFVGELSDHNDVNVSIASRHIRATPTARHVILMSTFRPTEATILKIASSFACCCVVSGLRHRSTVA